MKTTIQQHTYPPTPTLEEEGLNQKHETTHLTYPASPQAILSLQQQRGNQFVRRFLAQQTTTQTPIQREFDPASLSAYGNAEQTAFKRRVFEIQTATADLERDFVDSLDESALGTIEGDVRARFHAAKACRELLAAARADLGTAKENKDKKARRTSDIGVISGYRSAGQQFTSWDSKFAKYYKATADHRATLQGGEHGSAAARYLAKYIGGRLAAPGYSLHNDGRAIDFRTVYKGQSLSADTDEISAWKKSWFYEWMMANAARYHFYQADGIDEPWHWEYREPTYKREQDMSCTDH